MNAHPHISRNGRIAIVHNGIIESYLELREMLTKRAMRCSPRLLPKWWPTCLSTLQGDMMQALMDTVKDLRGSYALGILSADDPGDICTKGTTRWIIRREAKGRT